MSDAPDALSHVRADGAVHMVDVSAKQVTARRAVAAASVLTRPDVVELIAQGKLPKGEALAVARIAGIMAAKRTPELVPLCHPLPLTGADVELVAAGDRVEIRATVKTVGVTGVEMEALTAVSVAALTVYDMIKAVDKAAVITDVRVLEKDGGKSGPWRSAQARTV
ncbi:cyclic pyranopterin monophosphate synthase MoaC [Gryllotalpicola protaetiae]|uniref:Cyclic pyranopterin monophosphate synthase n=1 Tax=Gryllotalpicola protaetiae TaxID=2419771 RepID=A0A387BJB5_9MICO|nr:cyclic pyranopterin monophosphate synthase MoaC [Gryllotalpicola protaetiae]AYG02808.1 cyclic pyranopterin monophosphate synthase MoaC [Gryllotalpicola protaetiae]